MDFLQFLSLMESLGITDRSFDKRVGCAAPPYEHSGILRSKRL
jgi:hypothetical protein